MTHPAREWWQTVPIVEMVRRAKELKRDEMVWIIARLAGSEAAIRAQMGDPTVEDHRLRSMHQALSWTSERLAVLREVLSYTALTQLESEVRNQGERLRSLEGRVHALPGRTTRFD